MILYNDLKKENSDFFFYLVEILTNHISLQHVSETIIYMFALIHVEPTRLKVKIVESGHFFLC